MKVAFSLTMMIETGLFFLPIDYFLISSIYIERPKTKLSFFSVVY